MDNNDLFNFEESPEERRRKIEADKRHDRLDHLIYETFSTKQGKELLEIWSDALVMVPVAQPGMDMLGVGIEQGKRDFIRLIKLTLKRRELK